LFYCHSTLGYRVIQYFDLCELDDLCYHFVDTEWFKIAKYGISVQVQSTGLEFCRVDVLQELHIVIVVVISR